MPSIAIAVLISTLILVGLIVTDSLAFNIQAPTVASDGDIDGMIMKVLTLKRDTLLNSLFTFDIHIQNISTSTSTLTLFREKGVENLKTLFENSIVNSISSGSSLSTTYGIDTITYVDKDVVSVKLLQVKELMSAFVPGRQVVILSYVDRNS